MDVAMTSVAVGEKPKNITPKHAPLNTQEYLVTNSDSISSIALRFNTTPAELSRLNRLASRMLYPGQTLFVPGRFEAINAQKEVTKNSIELVTQEPCSVQRIERPLSPDSEIEALLRKDTNSVGDEISEKYLKLKAKFITDGQGVVSGVVLITPQTFMFNPCVSDHLVIERGRDAYALRFPLKSVADVTFFNDIAAMVTGDRSGQICLSPTKKLNATRNKNTLCSSLNDTSQTVDSAICQETGERVLSDNEPAITNTHNDFTLGDSFSMDTTIGLGIDGVSNTPKNVEKDSKTSVSDNPPGLKCCSPSDNNRHSRNSLSKGQFKSDEGLTENDSSITEVEVDDVAHSCPELGGKDDSSCLRIMRESQSTSTPRKLPSVTVNDSAFSNSTKPADSPSHTMVSPSLIDSPLRVRQLTRNKGDLTLLENEEIEDCFPEQGIKIPQVEREAKLEDTLCNKLTSNESDSDDERGRVPDISRDSGISEGGSIKSSYSRNRYNGDFPPKAVNTSNCKKVLSARSGLTEEARRWLGDHGVRLGSDSASSDISSTETREAFVEELLPRPAARYEDPPVYLCLRIHRSFWCPTRERSSSIMGVPPNRDQMRREHWFALPKERIDQVYAFFLSWSPNLDTRSEFSDDRSRKDDQLDESGEEGLNIVDDTFSCSPATHFGFEKLRADDLDSQDRISTSSTRTSRSATDEDLPEMLDSSDLLTRRHVALLSRELPSRTIGHSWALVYSTAVHGISLRTLYRNMADIDSPVLLTIVDENSKTFGTFMSDAPKMSDGFYGTGESMLYTFVDESHLKVYRWSGENNFFIRGDAKSLCIGGGDGMFGLWLDEDLYHGRSHSCKTFNNETLSFKEDFICSSLEAWTFV